MVATAGVVALTVLRLRAGVGLFLPPHGALQRVSSEGFPSLLLTRAFSHTSMYFNPTDNAALLHPVARGHDELAATAERAERDVIRRTGYPAADSTEAAELDARLTAALTDVIADVTSHRLRHMFEDASIKRSSAGERVTWYGDDFDPRWPARWREPLMEVEAIIAAEEAAESEPEPGVDLWSC